MIAFPIHGIKSRGNIYIHYKAKIGYGLYIGHGGLVVVNLTAMIGNNVNLSQFVSIDSNEGAASVGDNVYIGSNVCIVENVIIEDNRCNARLFYWY